jgi:hypothetical protein
MRQVILAIVGIALAMGAAGADHCETWSTSKPDTTSSDGRYYVDNDMCQPECIFSIWLYEESNGYDGLQRGDEVVDDTCHGMIDSDTIIF